MLGTLVKQLEELNRFKTFKMHVLLDYFSAVCFSRCFRLSDRVSHHRRRRRCRCFCHIVCACRHLCYEKRTKNYCENMYGSLLFTTTLYFFPSCLRPYLFERISWVALKLHWVLVCYIAANELKDIFKMLNDAFLCVYYFFSYFFISFY